MMIVLSWTGQEETGEYKNAKKEEAVRSISNRWAVALESVFPLKIMLMYLSKVMLIYFCRSLEYT